MTAYWKGSRRFLSIDLHLCWSGFQLPFIISVKYCSYQKSPSWLERLHLAFECLIHIPTFQNFHTSALQVYATWPVFCCLLSRMACFGIFTTSLTGVYLLALKAIEMGDCFDLTKICWVLEYWNTTRLTFEEGFLFPLNFIVNSICFKIWMHKFWMSSLVFLCTSLLFSLCILFSWQLLHCVC